MDIAIKYLIIDYYLGNICERRGVLSFLFPKTRDKIATMYDPQII